ncbi:MAG: rRNA maturation RNase YbeY [Lachnospiraceae bacterium]|nr:rRNA maturation RNase YbeY [Lachnospiraceae bacterium]
MIFCVEDERGFGQILGEDIVALACMIGERVLLNEGVEKSISDRIEASLYIVDDDEIREINSGHRGIDAATDVLSFPNIEYDGEDAASVLEAGVPDSEDPETGHILLGDIVIDSDRALLQAKEYGHSVRREFSFLIAHSMLHLLGYDHMTEDEAKLMENRQEAVLSGLGITRG